MSGRERMSWSLSSVTSSPSFYLFYFSNRLNLSTKTSSNYALSFPISPSSNCGRKRSCNFISNCTTRSRNVEIEASESTVDLDCLGTGLDVECLVSSSSSSEPNAPDLLSTANNTTNQKLVVEDDEKEAKNIVEMMAEVGVLVSPFFFWGTAMVAMKEVLPLAGPFFVAAFRLIPAGLLLVAFAAFKARPLPSGLNAWLSITLFALVDAACFQV